jgi:4-amino-4-deoxy-L-arabinose transferase-like glycosyltransferase
MSSTLTGTVAAAPEARPQAITRFLRRHAALLALLAGTAVLYLWGLGASGWANAYYSGAVQAGSQDWKAFFFGSFDSANGISVDKPPASLWVMALSVRIFGLSSWSILVPQALMGVAAVGLLYATVRRWSGAVAGLLAGAVLALTPVAVLMFRFNNPDALLVLLLMGGAYATVRAVETASTRWLILVGVFVGFAFLTKMLQAFLVVPAFALAYLIAAPTGVRRRIGQLLLGGLAMLVSAGWWVAIVELLPARYRPYAGGSENNSVLDLIFGYNGLGRIFGGSGSSPGGGGLPSGGGFAGGPFGSGIGILRMFESRTGGQIAWLLPAALVLLVAALTLLWRAPRTDRTRASLILWGGWLLVTGLVFSFMEGIYHEYYTVALAPAVAAVVAVATVALWQRRDNLIVLAALATTVAGTGVWAWRLLGRDTDWLPWLRWAVLALGIAAAVGLLAGRFSARVLGVAAVAAIAAALVAPFGYALNTAATEHRGSIPLAGPTAAGAGGGFPGERGFPSGFPGGGNMPDFPGLPGGNQSGGPGVFPNGMGRGGFDEAATVDSVLVTLLKRDADRYTWVAATVSATNAAGYQLAAEEPVLAIGGFGTDPWPTLELFQQYATNGRIHYFIGGATGSPGGMGRLGGAGNPSQQITQWVEATFTATTIGGVTVYDLTTPSA